MFLATCKQRVLPLVLLLISIYIFGSRSLDHLADQGSESAKTEQFYETSEDESFVLVSGPLLIKDSLVQKLPDMPFSQKRHPRTCLGINRESIVFVTIDGRQAGRSFPVNLEKDQW